MQTVVVCYLSAMQNVASGGITLSSGVDGVVVSDSIEVWKERISQNKTSNDSKLRGELYTILSSGEQRLVYLWVATHTAYFGRCVALFGTPPYHFYMIRYIH